MPDKCNNRQGFLGSFLEEATQTATIGIVGLSGGGSHVAQQLAHIGFQRYVLYDPDRIEDTNLHRVVGATQQDVAKGCLKVQIAERVVRGLRPKAQIAAIAKRWQDAPEYLRGCDLFFGCVDTFMARHELEVCSRRYLIPYIDIGMDVIQAGNDPPRMAGQVILSQPGGPCMWCLGYLNKDNLSKEASNYGNVGGRPQVIWANGILASSAVGMAIDLLCDWTRASGITPFLSFDGNRGTITHHIRLQYGTPAICIHHSMRNIGDPLPKFLE